MAGVNFIRLFNTRLEHTFYTSGVTKDLQVTPTSETLRAMKNSNMQFRNDDEGFRILYRVDESGAPFIDFKDVKLVFGVTLKNITEFLNITTLTSLSGYAPGKVMYIKNTNVTTTNLSISFLDFLKSAIFNYEFPQDAANIGDNGSIVIRNSQGNVVTPSFPVPTQVKANGAKKWVYPIDFSNMPSGLYEFETTGNASTVTKTVYIDNELVKRNVFAIIDLLAKDGKPANYASNYPTGREYKLIFTKRLVQWKYIVLLKSFDPNALPTIDIFDTNPTQPIYGQINFNAAQNTTVNGIPARIITSTATNIPYYETAKTGLNIRKDPGGNPETLLANIPGVPIGLTSAQTTPTINFDITEIFVVI